MPNAFQGLKLGGLEIRILGATPESVGPLFPFFSEERNTQGLLNKPGHGHIPLTGEKL